MLIRLVIFFAALLFLPACSKKSAYVPPTNTSTSTTNIVVYNTPTKALTPKYEDYAPVKGYGQISKATGRPRTNVVSGYWRGSHWVKPYARS